jgi:ubiquinone/menaquinone biosynthesis C-methylase UbiE
MNRDLTGYREQHEAIQEEFARQAASWGQDEIDADLRWAVGLLDLQPRWVVLDVAAGTGLLARAVAPHVKEVSAVDITPEMLAQGRRQAERDGTANVRFEEGAAEDLPYPPGSFDLVMTRFSLHHFVRPDVATREMARVCRPGGSLAVIDIVSPEDEDLAARYNRLERLRDPSHTRALPPSELKRLIEQSGIEITGGSRRDVPNDLLQWLGRTRTAGASRDEILESLRRELDGGPPTGMRPFSAGGRLQFLHAWEVVVGVKPQPGGEATRCGGRRR